MKEYKPHICKRHGVWEVRVSRSGYTPKSWIRSAERWTQRLNCRELFKQKSLEMFRNEQ